MPNDDVKTLREAAANFEEWFQHGNVQQLWPREQKALAILCARMADMIEREDAPDVEYDEDGPGHIEGKPAGYAVHIDRVKEREAAAEDRGWNAALDMAARVVDPYLRNSPSMMGSLIARLNDLRRKPRT